MKRIAIAVLWCVVVVGANGEMRPPEPQPGDEETFEITVGQAREALWYKEQYEMVEQELELCKKERDRLGGVCLSLRDKLSRAGAEHERVEGEVQRWRTFALVSGSVLLAEVVAVVVVLFVVAR